MAKRAATLGAAPRTEVPSGARLRESLPPRAPPAAPGKALTAFGKVVINGQQRLAKMILEEDDDDLNGDEQDRTHGDLQDTGT